MCDKNDTSLQSLFVCVEVLQPSQPNGVMSSAVSFFFFYDLFHFSTSMSNSYNIQYNNSYKVCFLLISIHKCFHTKYNGDM